MTAPGFDYQKFVQDMAQQAQSLVPQDFDDNQKQYVVGTLYNFSLLAGQALADDPSTNYTAEQAVWITQIIAEWSYHKSVDVIRSGIPQQYWDPVMQKIAFVTFEKLKEIFTIKPPDDDAAKEEALALIQQQVEHTYKECIEELKEKNLISNELAQIAESQSNIDTLTESVNENGEPEYHQGQPQMQEDSVQSEAQVPQSQAATQSLGAEGKVLKLATLALLFKRMRQDRVQAILNKFNPDDANSVIKFMNVPDLENKVDTYTTLKCLQEIRTNLPAPNSNVTPAKLIKKIQNIGQRTNRSHLESILENERPKVKRFVFSALEGEFYNVAPKVANIIAHHMELSV